MLNEVSGSEEKCGKAAGKTSTPNLPLIGGAYCFNNKSGICKAFAGRYEFFYNSFEDKFLYSAPKSKWVDQHGYHERVPVSYTTYGEILYADQSINWARRFAANELKGKNISLLSTRNINWCSFVADNHWPYKSAIEYQKYKIYFFNRQSCIVDSSVATQPKQHFNTRFLQNSTVRIDLDMNPTIYAMEDNVVGNEIRLVKHRRQHWYEVGFKVLKKPREDLDYFVDMDPKDKKPCRICGGRPILPNTAYRAFSNRCLDDAFHERTDDNNAHLVTEFCGIDQTEIADFPIVIHKKYPNDGFVLEVDLHNIPRRPNTTTNFFGVSFKNDEEWKIFAKDGVTFSAATTIPTANDNKVRVVMLYARFKLGVVGDARYDEYDPLPYIADYEATFIPNPRGGKREGQWLYDRDSAQVEAKNLNYVDDIAYLYKCNSLLVIFGPLYSELPVGQKITPDTKGPVDSIYSLGIWELANAFFAMPDGSNVLWVYYRTNHIAEHRYECTKPLVTAKRQGAYQARYGPGIGPPFFTYASAVIHEETLFKHIGVYKGEINSGDAPDPQKYEGLYAPPPKPLEEKNQTYLYIIIAIGILLIVIMAIICMIAVRRRIRRRRLMKTVRSTALDDGSHAEKSARSLLSWLPGFGGPSAVNRTQRSALSSRPSRSSGRTPRTVRSDRGSSPSSSRHSATVRSPSMSSRSRGSHAIPSDKGTKHSATVRSPSLSSGHGSRASSKHSQSERSSSNLSGSHKPSSQAKTARSARH